MHDFFHIILAKNEYICYNRKYSHFRRAESDKLRAAPNKDWIGAVLPKQKYRRDVNKMATEQIIMLAAVAFYLIAMVILGIICARKTDNVGDFYLGGRKLGPFVTAMSAEASDMSGWLLMGLPGLAYACGIAEASWTAIGLAIGTYLNWLIVSKRLRKYSQVCNAITIPDFFANRFKDKSNVLTLISALIIIVFFIPYTGSGFSACGKLFESLFGADYHIAMIISAVVIIAYTTIGGFLAASITDFIQSIIMTIALVIVVIFGVYTAGGLTEIMNNSTSMDGYLSLTKTFSVLKQETGEYSGLSIFSTLAWGLGYFGMPHVLLRFMAINDSKKLKTSRRVATIWVVISLAVAIFIGVVGLAMTANGSIADLTQSDPETIIVVIANLLAKIGPLAAVVGGIIIAGILASTMSTADSQLLAASSSVSENIIRQFFKLKVTEKTAMLIARITVIIIAIIGVIIAWDPNSSVFQIVSFAWAGFGAAFGPVVLTALFWKRTTKWGAFAGILAGGVMVFVWKFIVRPLGGALDIYELLPAFIVALAAIIIVSLIDKKPPQEIIDEFEAVKSVE